MTIRRRVSTLGFALLATLTIASCGKDDKVVNPPDDGYLPAISAANVLANLTKAYEEQRADKYAALFDSTAYIFEFSVRDHEVDPSLPVNWIFEDEMGSARRLFADPQMHKVVVDFTALEPVPATTTDHLATGPEGVWKVELRQVHLEVHVEDEQGQPLEYLVESDGAEFFFRQYPNESIDGAPRWRIVRWRDKPALPFAASGVRPGTWGQIKAAYGQEDTNYLPATSAPNVLSNLIRAYQRRNLSRYAALFDATEFRFDFSQHDRDVDPTLPSFMYAVDDRLSTGHIFGDDTVDRITLRLEQNPPVVATAADSLPNGPDGVWKIAAHAVHLEVMTFHSGTDEPLTFQVEADDADFFFRQYPKEPIGGQPSWKIVYWRDKPVVRAGLSVEPRSWGAIKNLYW